MSDFAEYVEQQQNLRFPTARSTAASSSKKPADPEHHEELEGLFDNLDLSDSAPRVPFKQLLLGADDDDECWENLQEVLKERLDEGSNEAVFDVGYENDGESMKLSLEEWQRAKDRLVEGARRVGADCDLLITKNVGGEKDAKPDPKDKSCSGKLLVRRRPASIEDVIETRIAVVGNGCVLTLPPIPPPPLFLVVFGSDYDPQSTLVRVHC